MKNRILSALLAFAFSLALAAPAAQAAYGHYDTAFEDMPLTGVDRSAVDAFCARFLADPVGQYDAMLALYDELQTQQRLFSIQSDCNAGDTSLSEAYEQVQNDCSYAADRLHSAIGEALRGKQGDALRALMPEGAADSFADHTAADDAALASSAQEIALIQDYYLLPDDENFSDAAAELYLRLVALRREQAEREGFDSFADYAYASSFTREYVPEDAQELHRIVKDRLAPLYVRCELALYGCDVPWDDEDVPDGDEVLTEIAARLGDVSPELCEPMEFLLRNRLYRIGSGDELRHGGYTVSLPAYRSLFLFLKYDSRFNAFEDTVHEFGHFSADYRNTEPALYTIDDIDISELQSQGLEVLFLPCLQDILAPDGDDAARSVVALWVLRELLSSVVDGCMYDEFEQAVYADPSLTVADLHRLEAELNAEYGLDEIYSSDVTWTYIPHLFEYPFYYVSYAASALPILDLYLRSLDDYDAAVDAYLNISAANGTTDWFLDVTEENGLCDITDRRDVSRLANRLEAHIDALLDELPCDGLDGAHGSGGRFDDPKNADTLYGAVIVLGALNLALLAAVVVLGVKLGKKERERAAKERDPWEIP